MFFTRVEHVAKGSTWQKDRVTYMQSRNPENPKLRQMADPNPPPEKAKAAAEVKKILSGEKVHFPNPPDPTNPDPATLREQWRYAIRQYSRMYSHAWGTAILAGASFFALGWFIKGGNPLPSLGTHHDPPPPSPADSTDEPPRA